MALAVNINYNLTEYLPASTESTHGLEVMKAEFDDAVPNIRIMVRDVSVSEALEYKEKIKGVFGVVSVTWLDDVASLSVPLEMQDPAVVKAYYHEGNALFEAVVSLGTEAQAVNGIYQLIGEENHATGHAVNMADAETQTASEATSAFLILVPLIIVILLLSTTSWLEPLFFLVAIGLSIVINLGTNLFLGEISFITLTVSPILQLAVSLDYAIFLLHAFQEFRETEKDVPAAMRAAMKKSFSAIFASAATTFFGFAALGFMQFRIGADLGFVLVKGIVFSFLCVVVFLPAFTLAAYRIIDKTQHRRLVPTFKGIGKPLAYLRVPLFVLVIVLVVPCYLAQSHTTFTYGMGASTSSEIRSVRDEEVIKEAFKQSTPTIVLVPRGDVPRELELVARLEAIEHVDSVLAYVNTVGAQIPAGFLDESITKRFYSEHYARMIVYADTRSEGTEAFAVVQDIRDDIQELYGQDAMTAGQAASLYDVKLTVVADNAVTTAIAIIAILLVLILTFRSALFPLVLITTIESAIFINLAAPYFTGDTLNYIGFLIINTVQLGATVDYAILFTDNYRMNRQAMPVRPALAKTLGDTFFSILVSASILAFAGFVLYLTSTQDIVSILGLLLFRGTLLSFFLVVTFLPGALLILDKAIGKTTWRARFFKAPKKKV
jgi:predicted RND superfamily exporter protein